MSNVTRLRHALPMRQDINKALNNIAKAIGAAKTTGLPQGVIVVVLHGQAHSQTAIMVT